MKKLAWFVAFMVSAVAGTAYYLISQVTAMPAWYGQAGIAANAIQLDDPAAMEEARRITSAQLAQARAYPDGTQEIILDERSLTAMAATEVDNLARTTGLTRAVRSVNSRIHNGQIESGAVINLEQVPTEQLSPTERELLTTLRQTLPALANREVYVGIEGKPTVVNGQLQFDDSLRIKIGNFSLTAAAAAQKLGLSPAELGQVINQELQNLQLKEVEISDNQIRLRSGI
jgi:hypothetical protein